MQGRSVLVLWLLCVKTVKVPSKRDLSEVYVHISLDGTMDPTKAQEHADDGTSVPSPKVGASSILHLESESGENNDIQVDVNEDEFLANEFKSFREWRHGQDESKALEGEASANNDPHPLSKQAIAELESCIPSVINTESAHSTNVTAIQTDYLRNYHLSDSHHYVAAMYFQDQQIENVLNLVDHIYIICMKCNRKLPASLQQKVHYLNGRKVDLCLKGSKVRLPGGDRFYAATNTHRMAVLHARKQGYKNVLVLEEDAIFDEKTASNLNEVKDFILKNDEDWDVIRLGWHSRVGGACPEVCQCSRKSVATKTCTQSKGFCRALHSSSGYILPSRKFDDFVTKYSRDVIDGMVLDQFKQTMMIPPIMHQSHHFNTEKGSEAHFVQKCVQTL